MSFEKLNNVSLYELNYSIDSMLFVDVISSGELVRYCFNVLDYASFFDSGKSITFVEISDENNLLSKFLKKKYGDEPIFHTYKLYQFFDEDHVAVMSIVSSGLVILS